MKKKPFLYCFSAEKFQEISGPRRKSGEKPHYMVEAPRRDSICGGWSRGKRFGIIDRQKVHPPGFLGKVYKGGIAMKGKKKLLSVLLAAALVGQMGVVVGVANGDCAANEHGRKSPVAAACGAANMHWLGGSTALQGGTGTNYFYPTANNTTINCAGEKNVVIFKTVPGTAEIGKQAEITITGFKDDTTLYIPQTSNVTADTHNGIDDSEEDESEELEERKLTIDNKCVITIQNENYGVYSGNIAPEKWSNTGLTAPSILEKDGKITVAPEDTTKYTYQWKAEKDGQPLEPVVLDIPTDPGVYQYTCTMIENATGKYSTATYKVTVGCVKKPAIAIDKIKATMGGKVTTNGGTLAALAADDTNTLTFTLDATEAITYNGSYCDGKDGSDHGYTAAWAAAEALPTGVTLAGNQLTIDAGKVVAGTHDVKINLSVTKGETAATGTVTFKLEKAEKQDIGGDTSESSSSSESSGNSSSSSSESSGSSSSSSSESSGGFSSSSSENSGSSSESSSSSGSSSSSSSSSSDGGENSGSSQPDPKPEKPTISVEGDTEGSDTTSIEITNGQTEVVTKKYKVSVNENTHTVKWTLIPEKDKNGNSTKDYIQCTESGTETIVTIKNVPPQTNETFTLTATITPKTQAKARTAAVDQNGVVTVQHEIKVVNTANDPDNNQGGTTTNPPPADTTTCEGVPKKVEITFDPVSPFNFGANAASFDKAVSWQYKVTEWENNKECKKTDCDHGLIWKTEITDPDFKWAVETPDKHEIVITGSKVPKIKNNDITLIAQIEKTENGKKESVEVGRSVFTVIRDPMCNATVKSVTITKKTKEMDTITVARNKTGQGMYYADIKYSEGEICDKEGHDKQANDHKAVVEWKVNKVTLDGKEWTNNKAFEISDKGVLTAHGNKLIANKTYSVEIQATAGGISDQATVTVKCTAPTSSGTTGGSSGSDDTDDTDWYQWQDFEDDISDAKRGSTVKVNLRDNTDMPFYIFDEVRGRDVNLQMKVSGGYTWTVNGKTVKKLPENQVWVALGVDSYKNSRMSTLCRSYDVKSFQLENKGSFYGDMKLTMNVGSSYAKKTMFLYSYDEDKNKLTYCSSSKADDTGDVSFVFARSLGAYVVTSKALYGESAVGSGGGTVGGTGSGNSPTTVYPPVASVPASKPPASSSSSSSSSSQSSSSSEPAPPPAEPSSTPDTTPTDTKTEPEQKAKIPVLVPVLILSIAGVITATVLVVRSGRGKEDF